MVESDIEPEVTTGSQRNPAGRFRPELQPRDKKQRVGESSEGYASPLIGHSGAKKNSSGKITLIPTCIQWDKRRGVPLRSFHRTKS
jgi:hypothetical protein